jgi:hypothetical protein
MQRGREKFPLPELDAVPREDELARGLVAGFGRRRLDAHREPRHLAADGAVAFEFALSCA